MWAYSCQGFCWAEVLYNEPVDMAQNIIRYPAKAKETHSSQESRVNFVLYWANIFFGRLRIQAASDRERKEWQQRGGASKEGDPVPPASGLEKGCQQKFGRF